MDIFRYNISLVLSEILHLPSQDIDGLIEIPPEEHLGDYALPCFRLGSVLKQSPQKIATDIASNIAQIDFVKEVKTSGGYVNFFLNTEIFISRALNQIEKGGFGKSEQGRGKTVVIDFSSPNIAKPFSVGHLRSTVIGNSLSRIYEYLGYNVIKINHLGDWGTQFGKIIVAFEKWGKQELLDSDDPVKYLVELYVRFHEESKKDTSLEEIARTRFKELEEGKKGVVLLWEKFKVISLKEFQRIYDILGVQFNSVTGESFYNTGTEDFIKRISSMGLTKESQGALIVDLERFGMPPLLLRKSDEATLYATRDLVCAIYRYEKYRFDKMLYVVGQDQRLHFKQVFQVLKMMGHSWADRCFHIDFGMIRSGGEKMSTRRGRVVLLEDVLTLSNNYVGIIMKDRPFSETAKQTIARNVGVAAVIFSDLKNKRIKDIDFDIEKALSYNPQDQTFKGQTGPYLQYINARLSSLLKRYGKPIEKDVTLQPLKDEQEFKVVRALYRYPEIVINAANSNEPSMIADYLLDVASLFSTYYQDKNKHKIISDNEPLSSARIRMCSGVKDVLLSGFYLLGINAVEEM
ncbi:arginine--tRNA ligase [bacterium Unc6]|nr:arginine--tRNA ligase [bacterium Unc6]